MDGGPGFGTVDRHRCQDQSDAVTDRTRLPSSGRSLAFSSPVSVAAIGPAQRLCHAGGMGDQDGLAAALDVFDE